MNGEEPEGALRHARDADGDEGRSSMQKSHMAGCSAIHPLRLGMSLQPEPGEEKDWLSPTRRTLQLSKTTAVPG